MSKKNYSLAVILLIIGLTTAVYWGILFSLPSTKLTQTNLLPPKNTSPKPQSQTLPKPQDLQPILNQSFEQPTQKLDLIAQLEKERADYAQFIRNHPYKNRKETYQEIKKMPKRDRPDLAMEQEFLKTVDPKLKYVPYEELVKANLAVNKRLKNLSNAEKAAIAGVNWRERGPDNVGGRTRAIMFDPNDATNRKVWAAGVTGGLWFNNDITNPNSTWQSVNDFWANIAVSCIAFDPNDTQTFYVGTGEGYLTASARGQ
ncbi:MAG: hypothetical protein MUE85_16020 [Microscillaceae bacterium]|jgi:hypothetical protein|nr:hypothetical protein [Microscillaceae bacterium]